MDRLTSSKGVIVCNTPALDMATCGEITRLENLGWSGREMPTVHGYSIELWAKGYEQSKAKFCKDIYEVCDFLRSIK